MEWTANISLARNERLDFGNQSGNRKKKVSTKIWGSEEK